MITRAEIEAVSATDPEVLDPELWDTRFEGGPPIGVRQAIVAHRRLVAQEKAAAEQRQNGDAEVADLHRRVDALEQALADDGDYTTGIVEGVAEVMPRFFEKELRLAGPTLIGELTAKVNALEEKVADLEAKPSMRYRGIWDESEIYAKGDVTTLAGGAWVAVSNPIDRPGKPDSGWQLAVKSASAPRKEPVLA
jgi:hypothetical protein